MQKKTSRTCVSRGFSIFENFYRSPQTKKRRGGSGLGLSLSKQIIRGHGGKITVTSEEERGSCFVFSLPLFTEAV